MSQMNRSIRYAGMLLFSVIVGLMLVGCKSNSGKTGGQAMPAAKPAMAETRPTIRINAGANAPYTDSSGNVWLPDQGFEGGDVVTREDDIHIANTKDAALYRNEHYSMSAFSYKVPNGKYAVRLHFCETYEENTSPGSRVFSFNVEGHEFKNFDLFTKAGGALRPYIETVNVDVTDGKLDITFTPNVENPEINGIEIIPD